MVNVSGGIIDRSIFPNRPQTAYGQAFEIRDASGHYQERASYTSPDIDIIDSEGLFAPDEVIIGIGRPNVFTLIPDEGGNHLRFAAKSLKRLPSKLEETKGRVQSSVFVILQGLSQEQIHHIYDSAKNHEGGEEVTCVLANMKMLHDAGISLGDGKDLTNIIWPGDCFKQITQHGLYMDGNKLNHELLKTSPRYLESQVFQTKKSVAMTPFRHGKRFLVKKGILKPSVPEEKKITGQDYPVAPIMKHETHHLSDITLTAANTPRISAYFRRIWGAHSILGIDQNRVNIDDYLEGNLKAYPQENPSFLTKVKKHVLFNRYIVGAINYFLQKGYSHFPDKTEADLHTLFETHSKQRPCKYNVVSSGTGSRLMKVDVDKASVDWVLTKHVLISNYDEDVRFAGEVWKDEEGTIWVNRNSGTYAPSKEQLDAFVTYLEAVFPHVTFQADYTL